MEREYNRKKAIEYSYKWALSRNPNYYNYDNVGGDCTNFISQCIFAGSGVMNYTKDFGWYYKNSNNKSPSWTGVEFLYKYLTRTSGSIGPLGRIIDISGLIPGDIIQLSFNNTVFGHSLFVTKIQNSNIYVSTHTEDNIDKPLSLYNYKKIRFIHIEKIII